MSNTKHIITAAESTTLNALHSGSCFFSLLSQNADIPTDRKRCLQHVRRCDVMWAGLFPMHWQVFRSIISSLLFGLSSSSRATRIQMGCLQLYLPPLPLTSMLCIFNSPLTPSLCLCATLASPLTVESASACEFLQVQRSKRRIPTEIKTEREWKRR